jgi:hypothetical protein
VQSQPRFRAELRLRPACLGLLVVTDEVVEGAAKGGVPKSPVCFEIVRQIDSDGSEPVVYRIGEEWNRGDGLSLKVGDVRERCNLGIFLKAVNFLASVEVKGQVLNSTKRLCNVLVNFQIVNTEDD